MGHENFDKVVARTLKWEGGFVDNPNDPGGRTNKGITQKEYDKFRSERGFSPADVKDIVDIEVQDIYYLDYFLPAHADLFSDIKVQWKVFDIAVNMGIGRALRFVQKIIGVSPDGQFGPKSQAALLTYQINSDWGPSMLGALVNLQTEKYQALVANNPKLAVFLKGWLRRATDIGDGLS